MSYSSSSITSQQNYISTSTEISLVCICLERHVPAIELFSTSSQDIVSSCSKFLFVLFLTLFCFPPSLCALLRFLMFP
eukprot:m.47844 g.47844  ORF g.47844 m.47844 type:complete len:78 (+) comp17706_c0_seq2:851-1084(+)